MKKRTKKEWHCSWLRSEHFWLTSGGLMFLAILSVKHENWCGVASITCFALSLGLHLVDRMSKPVETIKPKIKFYR